jgi:hypothetical protein
LLPQLILLVKEIYSDSDQISEELLNSIPKKDLYEFITSNRLQGRFLRKFNSTHISSESELAIKCEYELICKQAINKLKLLKELYKYSSSLSMPVIIKGLTVPILLNNHDYIRYSGDIDIISEDPNVWAKVFSLFGFSKSSKQAAEHEFMILEKGETLVEIHSYFPFISFPKDVNKVIDLKFQCNLGETESINLYYSDIHPFIHTINSGYGEGISVLSPEMSTIILCGHIFKDIFWEPYKIPRIRMVELLEICDLIKHKSFHFQEFKKIIETLKLQYIIAYIFSFIDSILSTNLLIQLGYDTIQPIVKLMNAQLSPYKRSVTENYFIVYPFANFSDLIMNIEPVAIKENEFVSTRGKANTYYVSTSTEVSDFTFKVALTSSVVVVTFVIAERSLDHSNYFAHINGAFVHLWVDTYPLDIRCYSYDKYDYNIIETSLGYNVEIKIKKTTSYSDNYILIAHGLESEEYKCSTIIPLCITSV